MYLVYLLGSMCHNLGTTVLQQLPAWLNSFGSYPPCTMIFLKCKHVHILSQLKHFYVFFFPLGLHTKSLRCFVRPFMSWLHAYFSSFISCYSCPCLSHIPTNPYLVHAELFSDPLIGAHVFFLSLSLCIPI